MLLRGFHRTAWIAFFLLTLLLQPRQGGSGCIRVFGFAVGVPRAIIPARRLACRRSFAGSRHAARKPCSPTTRGQTFKRSRGSELWPAIHGGHPSGHRCAMSKTAPGSFVLSAWLLRGPTRLHELRLATSRDFNGIAVLRCCTDTVEMAGIRQHEARVG